MSSSVYYDHYKPRDYRGSFIKNLHDIGLSNKRVLANLAGCLFIAISSYFLTNMLWLSIMIILILPSIMMYNLFTSIVKENQLQVGDDFNVLFVEWFQSDEEITLVDFVTRHYDQKSSEFDPEIAQQQTQEVMLEGLDIQLEHLTFDDVTQEKINKLKSLYKEGDKSAYNDIVDIIHQHSQG